MGELRFKIEPFKATRRQMLSGLFSLGAAHAVPGLPRGVLSSAGAVASKAVHGDFLDYMKTSSWIFRMELEDMKQWSAMAGAGGDVRDAALNCYRNAMGRLMTGFLADGMPDAHATLSSVLDVDADRIGALHHWQSRQSIAQAMMTLTRHAAAILGQGGAGAFNPADATFVVSDNGYGAHPFDESAAFDFSATDLAYIAERCFMADHGFQAGIFDLGAEHRGMLDALQASPFFPVHVGKRCDVHTHRHFNRDVSHRRAGAHAQSDAFQRMIDALPWRDDPREKFYVRHSASVRLGDIARHRGNPQGLIDSIRETFMAKEAEREAILRPAVSATPANAVFRRAAALLNTSAVDEDAPVVETQPEVAATIAPPAP